MWLSISTSRNTPKGNKDRRSKRSVQPHVYSSIIHNRQAIETAVHQLMKRTQMRCVYACVCVCVCVCVMEYYTSMRKKVILPFATWIDFYGIMLSDRSQTEKGKCCIISYVELKKSELTETETWMVVTRGWKMGVLGRCWSNLQLEDDKLWSANAQLCYYSYQYCIICFKVAKRLDLKCSHHTNTHTIMCEIVEVLADTTVVIILKYKNVSNQHVMCLKLT